jgi:hypothetical protein
VTAEPEAVVDVDTRPPTQYLILEVLAARHRLGEQFWTFPTRLTAAVRALESAGLVWSGSAPTPNAMRVGLTGIGRVAALHGPYVAPIVRTAQSATLSYAAGRLLVPAASAVLYQWAAEVKSGTLTIPAEHAQEAQHDQ